MMKKISIFVFVALLAATLANANTRAKTNMTFSKSEATVRSIDQSKHVLTASVGTKTETYQFTNKTVVLMNGKSAKWSDVKVGDHIDIYSDSNGFVQKIRVEAPGTMSK